MTESRLSFRSLVTASILGTSLPERLEQGIGFVRSRPSLLSHL